ncbi:MAG TPA: nucleotide exchange factor GrpE [Candidatus Omnitrophota bacterium]|nr:nucleotide exchange factor GrpE [Candidatus Omnitrophota bacterium]
MAKNNDKEIKKEDQGAQQPEKNGKDKETVILSKTDFEQLKADAEKSREHWDRLLRQQAEFENIRKRMDKEKQEFQKYACEEIVAELLGIMDDLERSVEAAEKGQENFEAFLKGIEMILAHLYELLKSKGVAAIDAKGKKFNPLEQEALMQTETHENEDGEVLEELQKGYKIGDRVIRTSKVRVAKKVEKK